MLRLFRHIRQRWLFEGNVSKYIGYAVGEIVLIVVGIMIALQVSEWADDRKRAELEKELIANLCDEVTNISECSHMANCRKCDECVLEPITTDEAVENNVPRYGDGILHPLYEQCDDGNQIGGDGCDLTGDIEENYECPTPNSRCNLICGNGDINSGEECDDDNQIRGDGCSLCRVDDG